MRNAIVGVLVGFAVCGGAGQAQADGTVTVTRVIDGGTVVVTDRFQTQNTVRIVGIDAPARSGEMTQCGSTEATMFAVDTLVGRRVSLQNPSSQPKFDTFGRERAYLVLPDGRNYSVEAVRAGVARANLDPRYPAPAFASELAGAERSAQATDRGLWGAPCFAR